MAANFTLIIKSSDDRGIDFSIKSETPVKTCLVVGALEMCKLMAFEKKIPEESVDSETECGDTPSTPQQDKRKMIEAVRKIRLADEKLSYRVINALINNGIVTLEDLLRYTKKPLLRIRNLGKKSIKEIEQFVRQKYKYEFGTLAPIWIGWRLGRTAMLSDMTAMREFGSEEEKKEWISRENCLIIQREEGLL